MTTDIFTMDRRILDRGGARKAGGLAARKATRPI
jgi:hypothetical protein